MARLPRLDRPGAWFHVMNRGIARRVVFPDMTHMRVFLACLAWAVRRGDLEVHAFCLMATHFHLLVRSPTGNLSEALGRAINAYVRWANRRARRDGALFRGRFRSRPVLSLRYRDVLVRYIEHNPIAARVVQPGQRYPYASSAHQARPRRPRWLATWWIDEVLARVRRTDPQATYDSVWAGGASQGERALVHERSRRPASTVDDLDDLVGAAAPAVRAWMERKARLADGRGARPSLVDPETVLAVLEGARRRLGPWMHQPKRGPSGDLWAVATCGLLHALAGQTLRGCAAWLRVAPARVTLHLARHRAHLRDPAYATRLSEVAEACLRRAHPAGADPRWTALRESADTPQSAATPPPDVPRADPNPCT